MSQVELHLTLTVKNQSVWIVELTGYCPVNKSEAEPGRDTPRTNRRESMLASSTTNKPSATMAQSTQPRTSRGKSQHALPCENKENSELTLADTNRNESAHSLPRPMEKIQFKPCNARTRKSQASQSAEQKPKNLSMRHHARAGLDLGLQSLQLV